MGGGRLTKERERRREARAGVEDKTTTVHNSEGKMSDFPDFSPFLHRVSRLRLLSSLSRSRAISLLIWKNEKDMKNLSTP